MIRWTVVAAGAMVVGGIVAVAVARALGWSESRPALAVSVVSQWLAAWVLWGLAGHLALQGGLLGVYEPAWLAIVAIPAGFWQYRAAAAAGRERGRTIFVGAQLLWLVVVLVRNGFV